MIVNLDKTDSFLPLVEEALDSRGFLSEILSDFARSEKDFTAFWYYPDETLGSYRRSAEVYDRVKLAEEKNASYVTAFTGAE